MSDPRLTPANARVAHDSLRGHIEAPYYVPGEWHSVTSSIADILRNPFGARDRQALFGERVLVLERRNGHAFIQAERDGYVGYMDESALGPDQKATHWVASAGTHLYPEPDFKCREDIALSLGARLTVTGEEDRFAKTANGQFVPRDHIKTTQDWHKDPAAVATLLLGTPYVWGGNSRAGIDCSGLMQAALLACGIPCPGDSDMQMSLGQDIALDVSYERGDLLFWKGHVAMVVDKTRIIHANAHHMAVAYEGLNEAIKRIAKQGDGQVTAQRRL